MTLRDALREALRRQGVAEEEIKARTAYADSMAGLQGQEEVPDHLIEPFIEMFKKHWAYTQTTEGQEVLQAEIKKVNKTLLKNASLN